VTAAPTGFEREPHVPKALANGALPVDDPPEGFFDDGPGLDADAPAAPPPWEALVTPAPVAWFTTAPGPRSWLLRDNRRTTADGVLPLGKVGQLIAEGGAGKTMADAQLAISVTTGAPWLGTFTVADPGRVLLVMGEEDREEAHRRLFRARRAMNAPIPPEGAIVVLPLAGVPCSMLERDPAGNLYETPFAAWLSAWVRSHGPWRLLVVDPLSRFAGADAEIDNAAATRFVQSLESIAALSGATLLIAHHTNKLSRRGGVLDAVAGRGSSALVDGVRWQAALGVERFEHADPETRSRLGEVVTWSNPKTNYSRRADPVLLRRDLDNGGALVPLDEADIETVRRARAVDLVRVERVRAVKAEQTDDRKTEDKAVRQAVAERPGMATRDLATRVQAIAHIGRGKALVAIARVAPELDIRPGKGTAQLHFPKGPAA